MNTDNGDEVMKDSDTRYGEEPDWLGHYHNSLPGQFGKVIKSWPLNPPSKRKMMKLRIEKFGYSSNPWRLVDENGGEITYRAWIDHADIGKTMISQSVMGNTKRECTEDALSMLAKLIELRLEKQEQS